MDNNFNGNNYGNNNQYQQNGYQQNGYNQNGYNQNGYQQNAYQQDAYNQGNPGAYQQAPQGQYAGYGMQNQGPLKTDYSLVAYILLGLVTCGIYPLWMYYKMIEDVNVACAGDGQETPGFWKFFLLTIVTCGIYQYIFWYNYEQRLRANAPRYGLYIEETGTTVLLWLVFGAALAGVGVFIGFHILIKNTNLICGAYNNSLYGRY